MTQLDMLSSTAAPGGYLESSAVISPCGRYRYSLVRVWDRELPRVLFCMINPSTADAAQDDATIRKCVGFARRWNMGSIEVVNLFAWRSKDVADLRRCPGPVGPSNSTAIAEAAARAQMIVAAWGPKTIVRSRAPAVLELLTARHDVHAIALSKDGTPCHPLMLSYDLVPVEMKRAARKEQRRRKRC